MSKTKAAEVLCPAMDARLRTTGATPTLIPKPEPDMKIPDLKKRAKAHAKALRNVEHANLSTLARARASVVREEGVQEVLARGVLVEPPHEVGHRHVEVVLNGNDHAFIEWSEGWRGGSLRIDRDASGKLVLTHLQSWIS